MRPATTHERKLIASLQQTKHRRNEGLFTVEGTRGVCDTLGLFDAAMVVVTNGWLRDNPGRLDTHRNITVLTASETEMARMSGMKTPQGVIAVYRIPEQHGVFTPTANQLTLALDCIQDPGNMGTIIRLADWFGVSTILASDDTVDAFNPKVVQATMGALARVEVRYCNLSETLAAAVAEGNVPVYGTFLDGTDIYATTLSEGGIIVMGNEGNGISPQVERCIGIRLLIPSYPPGCQKVESLNVATATAITLSEFRRCCVKR